MRTMRMLATLFVAALLLAVAPAARAQLGQSGLVGTPEGITIVTDPANPYWFTEGEVAKATAESLGYEANVSAHKGDTNAESTLIDTAITN